MFTQQKMIRRKKNVKKGIQFCLMVCGASGTGESPFIALRPDRTSAD
jgi:cell division control protein 11